MNKVLEYMQEEASRLKIIKRLERENAMLRQELKNAGDKIYKMARSNDDYIAAAHYRGFGPKTAKSFKVGDTVVWEGDPDGDQGEVTGHLEGMVQVQWKAQGYSANEHPNTLKKVR